MKSLLLLNVSTALLFSFALAAADNPQDCPQSDVNATEPEVGPVHVEKMQVPEGRPQRMKMPIKKPKPTDVPEPADPTPSQDEQ